MTPESLSAAKLLFGVALSFATASVYLNKKSDAWADRCLFLAYGVLAIVLAMLWEAML